MPPGIGYGKKVKVDPKSKLGKNIKKDRVKIKQTTQDRLDEAEGKKKGKKTNTQTKQDRLDEAEGKKKGKMKFKVVKAIPTKAKRNPKGFIGPDEGLVTPGGLAKHPLANRGHVYMGGKNSYLFDSGRPGMPKVFKGSVRVEGNVEILATPEGDFVRLSLVDKKDDFLIGKTNRSKSKLMKKSQFDKLAKDDDHMGGRFVPFDEYRRYGSKGMGFRKK